LARRENSADRFSGGQWQDAPPEVAHILASLVRQETRTGSVRIARDLVGSLDQDLPMLENPDRHAGFVVLKAADIPSVLVEMGFMSNPHDEAALRQATHRKLVAQAMHRAVDAYFTGFGHVAGGLAGDAGPG
jgi:N-acetylmuramoyl-L-alanine amidase